MSEQPPLDLDPAPQEAIPENPDIARENAEARRDAHHNVGRFVVEKTQAARVAEPSESAAQDTPTARPVSTQTKQEIESAWMIKEAGEPAPLDDKTIESQENEAWTLREAEQDLHEDEVTGLPNTKAFFEHAEKQLQATPENQWIGFIDLDRFKELNDTQGHEAGDTALRNISKVLSEQIPDQSRGMVARLHGDEFAFVLQDMSSQEQVDQVLSDVRNLIAQIQQGEWQAGISIGVANGSEIGSVSGAESNEETEQLIKGLLDIADARMYKDKQDRHAGRQV